MKSLNKYAMSCIFISHYNSVKMFSEWGYVEIATYGREGSYSEKNVMITFVSE